MDSEDGSSQEQKSPISPSWTSYQALNQRKRKKVLLESYDSEGRNTLHLAISDRQFDFVEGILDDAEKMSESEYRTVVLSPDNNGETSPLVATKKMLGGDKGFWNFLKRVKSEHFTARNNAGENGISLLSHNLSRLVASDYEQSKVVDSLRNCSTVIRHSKEICGDCNQGGVPLMNFKGVLKGELKKGVSSAEWRSDSCSVEDIQSTHDWPDMQPLVQALPPQVQIECYLSETQIPTFRKYLKSAAFEAIEELLGNTKCEPCLKKTLMSSYWKMQFGNSNMSLAAIKAFTATEYCTEGYLIPKPSEQRELSRPLAMMFYHESRGDKVGAEKDATDLKKAFIDGLGWPECSVWVQPKEFKWSGDELMTRIKFQLKNEEDGATNATNCSLFILFISCHGSAGNIKGHPFLNELEIEKILEQVDKCLPAFIPKVYIIDACQVEKPVLNPSAYIRKANTLLLMATVRGEYAHGDEDKGGAYTRYLVEEIKRGNDSLQNMHVRAALGTMSYRRKPDQRTSQILGEEPDQVAVSQSTTAKKIFLRKFNYADGCNMQDCSKPIDKTNSVVCINCSVAYHAECVPQQKIVWCEAQEKLAQQERAQKERSQQEHAQKELAQNELETLQKRGVYWFCLQCEDRLVSL